MNHPNIKQIRSIVMIFAISLLWACSGDDGSAGPAGASGPAGPAGPPGDPAPVPDPVATAIESSKAESCATCHDGVGDDHQAIYEKYVDASAFVMTFNSFTTLPGAVAGTFDATLDFSITKNGAPFTDYAGLDEKSFIVTDYDSVANEYLNGRTNLDDSVVMVTDGNYVLTEAGIPFDPTVNGMVYGYIADVPLFTHEGAGSELPAGSHVHLYDDVANTALAFGDADVNDPDAYVSAANVAGCEKCHGAPYMKHGYRDPVVAGLPDFGSCKSCHYTGRNGFVNSWQYMVDEPLNWANGAPATVDYTYEGSIMNDTHMSHAMEFPYPQSMSNCSTCHEGKLTQVLDNSNFTPETCKSCHAVQGLDAWPEELAGQLTTYNQPHRAPPMEYLWEVASVATFHDMTLTCTTCHGDPAVPTALAFDQLHTGYDIRISDAAGQKYGEMAANTVSIDQVTLAGDMLTINFSVANTAIIPEVLVSLYGWDSKNFIIDSHARDGSGLCPSSRGDGCQMEYVPESSGGDPNPLFMEDAASMPGDWMVTLDMAAFVPTQTLDIPTLIMSGDIKMAEITITPELVVGGEDVVLNAVGQTFDLNTSMAVNDYFKGANATVDTAKCDVCHDSLASSFHDGSGRGGGGIQVCKNCHVTTSPGSHLEMASRAIDSYTHAIHSFQPFDLDDVAAANDPVEDARTAQHLLHTFPNFTIRNCEACHIAGTYNVPDQSKSMPGVLSKSWDIADRNIGTVPEYVTGPASRACGGCHRADLINADLAGDLAALNAHTEAFGTLVENDDDDAVVYGVIDKIMSMFE